MAALLLSFKGNAKIDGDYNAMLKGQKSRDQFEIEFLRSVAGDMQSLRVVQLVGIISVASLAILDPRFHTTSHFLRTQNPGFQGLSDEIIMRIIGQLVLVMCTSLSLVTLFKNWPHFNEMLEKLDIDPRINYRWINVLGLISVALVWIPLRFQFLHSIWVYAFIVGSIFIVWQLKRAVTSLRIEIDCLIDQGRKLSTNTS